MSSFTYSGKDEESVPRDTESLTITEAVQELPGGFCTRSHLQKVVFTYSSSSGIQTIPNNAFSGCEALREIVIPPTVTTIGDWAFWDCNSLAEFVFPDGLKTIGKGSFAASGLREVRVPGSVKVIEETAFRSCESLRQVELLEGVKVIGQNAFCACSIIPDISLPSTVEVIYESSFAYCSSLTTVGLPKGLKKIGRFAFDHDGALQSIVVPSGVEHLEDLVFAGCTELKEVLLEHGLKTIGLQVFFQCKSLPIVSIPDTVNSIGDFAFESFESLVEVTLVSGSLRSIGEEAFAYCFNLLSVWIPYSVKQVGDRAFRGCNSLVTVEIPEQSQASFGPWVFKDCPLLANVSVPTSVHQDEIFQNCSMIVETYGESNVCEGIRTRFEDYPIHKACYYSSSDGADFSLSFALRKQLESPNPRDYTYQLLDPFGMTPFHILMSAAKKRSDLLQILLDNYPARILGYKNRNGAYALDYLVLNWTSEARSMAEMALQKWMVEGMESWGLPEWRSVMSQKVHLVLSDDLETDDRRGALHEACRRMGRYELMEAMSLLEMWLWKMKMQSTRRGGTKKMAIDRESSRSRCGAEFIVPSIADYLRDSNEE